MSDLLPALRALTSFAPPATLPPCDLAALSRVLVAHGLAPMASYQLETTRLGAGLPEGFRETLLGHYQGTVNDNVMRLVTLRNALKDAPDVPVVLLESAAFVDWLYPHMAWRPVSDLRLAVRGADGARLAAALARGGMRVDRTGEGGRTAVLTDGTVELHLQEGLWRGGPEDAPLYERSVPSPAFGPGARRPSPEDALLALVGDLAQDALFAPLIRLVDLRELLARPLDAAYVTARAAAAGLSRALHGAARLVAWFFPEVAAAAGAVTPALGPVERAAVDQVVEAARDPARLAHVVGVEAAARLLLAPGR